MSDSDWLVRVEAPHYVAGFRVLDGQVIEAAPILHWATGRTGRSVTDYCKRKGFKIRCSPWGDDTDQARDKPNTQSLAGPRATSHSDTRPEPRSTTGHERPMNTNTDDASSTPFTFTWSSQQEAIFEDVARGKGHTVIEARAGSAKTTSILEGLKHVPAGASTLLCAFSKPIERELQARVTEDRKTWPNQVRTLHSIGLAAIRRRFPAAEVDKEDEKLDNIVTALMPRHPYHERGTVRKLASLSKSCLAASPSAIDAVIDDYAMDVEEDRREEIVALALRAMIKSTEDVSVVDYDDMIFFPRAMNLPTMRFDRVFVDEGQDLSPAQEDIVFRTLQAGARLCALGDSRQAIFQFRGAGTGVLASIAKRFSAKTLPLTISYRCPRAVVEYARQIVPDYEAAPHAPLGKLTRDVTTDGLLRNVKDGDFILSRYNAPLTQICIDLIGQGKRATIAGQDIGQRVIGFVRRRESKAKTISALRGETESWRARECKRLKSKGRSYGHVNDLASMIEALSRRARTIDDLVGKVSDLFSDTGRSRIECSSVHKAKGLERNRVWMLEDTFDQSEGAPVEEANLRYVAATRAKQELYLVKSDEHRFGGGRS